MAILQSLSTLILFIMAAITGTLGPKLLRFGSWVPYVGGFCTAFGIVDAYLHGASTQEILLAVLLICILTVTGRWVWNRIDRKVQKGEQNEL